MNQEDISGNSSNSPAQQGKSATDRRGNKSRNRPVLVSSTTEQEQSATSNGAVSASASPVVETTSATSAGEATPVSPVRNRPKFFSTIGRKAATTEEKAAADPAAARLARATRGKAASNGKKEQPEAKTQPVKEVAPAKATPARTAPARPRSAFKSRHFIGILIYIIVADFVGVAEKNWLVSAKLEKLLFNLGPLPVYLSTVLFLLTLVLLLIVLARFDLVPRSLGGAARPAPKGTASNTSRSSGAGSKGQPTIKQGVKGANDDLYQEYRQNQRYWQRRDRKK